MWCSCTSPATQRRTVVPEVARPPVASATVGPGSSSSAAWSSAIRTGQPPSGAGPATATSPPRLTSTPVAEACAAHCALRSAASAFAVAPRSSSTSRSTRTVRRSVSSSIRRQPGTGANRARNEAPLRSCTLREACGRSRRGAASVRRWGRRARRSMAAAETATSIASNRSGLTATGPVPASALSRTSSESLRNRLHAASSSASCRSSSSRAAARPSASATHR